MSSNETKGIIPHQREPLSSEAQKQWDLMRRMATAVRLRIYRRTGLPGGEIDDIEAKVWESVYRRLLLSGPLDGKVDAYLSTVVGQKVGEHLAELAEWAAKVVVNGDEILERQPCPGPEEQSLADLAPALKILRGSMSDFQLRAFVLAEAYGMKAPFIAKALGGTATANSVRDALRHARRKRTLLFGDIAGD
ncbi:hypothetical protein [Streptomyces sp. WAC08241]|uniref:hypothetical protein n=1 Tax=Streptomyces sp. WAC08241 TaxID=2487421 RepID=UPI000F7B51AD|nr:hypothetical protein [Streptomyces sp. WAC08241]RSS42760.1 hypothetical protein EF906_11485 [Streptomyces sp. WAC08241]